MEHTEVGIRKRGGRIVCLIVGVCIAFAATADDFILSGDPVAAAMVGSCSAASPGKALVTDALTASSTSRPVEARVRTWLASLGTALRSDKWISGFKFIFR